MVICKKMSRAYALSNLSGYFYEQVLSPHAWRTAQSRTLQRILAARLPNGDTSETRLRCNNFKQKFSLQTTAATFYRYGARQVGYPYLSALHPHLAISAASACIFVATGVGLSAVGLTMWSIFASSVGLHLFVGRGEPCSQNSHDNFLAKKSSSGAKSLGFDADPQWASLRRRVYEANDTGCDVAMQIKRLSHVGLLGLVTEVPLFHLAKMIQPHMGLLSAALMGLAIGTRGLLQIVRLPVLFVDAALLVGLSCAATVVHVVCRLIYVAVVSTDYDVFHLNSYHGQQMHDGVSQLLAASKVSPQQNEEFYGLIKFMSDQAEAVASQAVPKDLQQRKLKFKKATMRAEGCSNPINDFIGALAAAKSDDARKMAVSSYCATKGPHGLFLEQHESEGLGLYDDFDRWVERFDDVLDLVKCKQFKEEKNEDEGTFVAAFLSYILFLHHKNEAAETPFNLNLDHSGRVSFMRRALDIQLMALQGDTDSQNEIAILTRLVDYYHEWLSPVAQHRVGPKELTAVWKMLCGKEEDLLKDILFGQRAVAVMDQKKNLLMGEGHPPEDLAAVVTAAWYSSEGQFKNAPDKLLSALPKATVATVWGRIPAHQAQLLRAWYELSKEHQKGSSLFVLQAVKATLEAL